MSVAYKIPYWIENFHSEWYKYCGSDQRRADVDGSELGPTAELLV